MKHRKPRQSVFEKASQYYERDKNNIRKLGACVCLLAGILTTVTVVANNRERPVAGITAEERAPSKPPEARGQLSSALEKLDTPEEKARFSAVALLDMLDQAGGFDPLYQECGDLPHCGGREFVVPPSTIYDREQRPQTRNLHSRIELAFSREKNQFVLLAIHRSSLVPPAEDNTSPDDTNIQFASTGSESTQPPLPPHAIDYSSLSISFASPEGTLKQDGTIDLTAIADEIRNGHDVNEVHASLTAPNFADIDAGMAYDAAGQRWEYYFDDVGAESDDDESMASDMEASSKLWEYVGVTLGAIEHDVQLGDTRQAA